VENAMKHKKFLLVTFLLTLFVFQQVQAGATMPPTENPSQVSLAPAYAPLPTIGVFVLWLNPDTNAIDGQPRKCVTPYEHHGCGTIDPTNPDNPKNPAYIPVGQSVDLYLQDVLTIEMDVAEIPPVPEEFQAFKAQAVAARTFASWKAVNLEYTYYPPNGDPPEGGNGHINNSTQYQVFIPGSYNESQAANKSLILQAISDTQGQYLSFLPDGFAGDGTRKTIDAEFGSEAGNQTEPEPGKDYMITVQEPNFQPSSNSTICETTRNYSGKGMSQRGAIRWARGNTCPDGTGTKWSVTWTDYRQILAHYYTGIDILNASGGKVAPDDRHLFIMGGNYGYGNSDTSNGMLFLGDFITGQIDRVLPYYQFRPVNVGESLAWSPDGSKLLINCRIEKNVNQVCLISVQTGGQ